MPLPAESLESIIAAAVSDAVGRVTPTIQRHIALLAAEELERKLAVRGGTGRLVRAVARTRRRPEELTKWVADARARRVPKFVIEMTGLDTKKKIVAKFGVNAAFEKGKPLPKTK